MMELKNQIILVYDKSKDKFIEKSEEIDSVISGGNYTFIKYRGTGKEYKYNPRTVLCLELLKQINPSSHDIYLDGQLQTDLRLIGDYGTYYAFFYNTSGVPAYIIKKSIELKHNNIKNILSYFSEVASLHVDDNEESSEQQKEKKTTFLRSQLKKIKWAQDSVLDYYLNGKKIKDVALQGEIIYPFDVNTSQKKAVREALTHNISIIKGPPGTGKTQSILNLIANVVYRGKSIGIVSNNNSAIENVKDKLEKKGYGFLTAHLGNNENQKRFFETLPFGHRPDPAWKLEEKVLSRHKKELKGLDRRIERLLYAKEELARCREFLFQAERENNDFIRIFQEEKPPAGFEVWEQWDSGKLMRFKTAITYFPNRIKPSLLFLYITCMLRYKQAFRLAVANQDVNTLIALDCLIYTKKIREIRQQIRNLEEFIKTNDISQLLKTYSDLSTGLFRHNLYLRYSVQKEVDLTAVNYRTEKFKEFRERFPVIISTTHSILNSVSEPLDYIVIDESSQVDIITATLAFSACRNVIIVGDNQQLSHIVPDEIRKESDRLLEQFHMPPAYDYVNQNIIGSLTTLYQKSIAETLLQEHYRCNPLIIGFCNRKFYRGELIMMKDEPAGGYDEFSYPLRIFRTEDGLHGHDKRNERQVDVIERDILPSYKDILPTEQIGIISPYRNQANDIADRLCQGNAIESDTIHKFQGREKKLIVFSTVTNEITPFMDKAELVNVAVSRAEEQFIMVMPHHYTLQHGSNIGDLIRYIERYNPYGAVQSKIISCFDLLHESHPKALDRFKKAIKGVRQYKSEELIEELLTGILGDPKHPEYSGFDLKMGYPLYLMIHHTEGLNEREISFCRHRCSHVDFLIINRCDNSFVLAIEVDGYNYHSNAEQQERDAIKDKVLALNKIELLRLSTRGHSEDQRIRQKLEAIVPEQKR